jgi:adhesin transport system outer membrane protein
MLKNCLKGAVIVIAGILILGSGHGQAQPASDFLKARDGFLQADKDGFIKSSPQAVESPKVQEPAVAPQAVEPPKAQEPAVAPQAVEPPKAQEPAVAPQAVEPPKAQAASVPKMVEPVKQPETLPEAIQQVLVNHPDIKGSAYGRQARDMEVVQARAPFLPKIDASMSWGVIQQDKPFSDRTWPSQSTVSLRQNLFRGGADYSDVKRQEARVKAQAYLLQGTSENIALLTAKVYMNVLRNTELSELAKENLTNHERIGDQVKLRMQSGVDRGADLAQVTGRLALAQSNIVVTTANLQDAKTDYQSVVNKLPGDLAKIQPVNVPLPASFEEAEQLALKNYPIVKSAKADLESRKAQYEVAKRQLSPSFDVAADYNWTDDVSTNTRTGLLDRRDYFSASAVLSINLFNGLRNQGRIKETMYLIREAEQIFDNTQRQTVQSIRLSLEAYMAAQDRVKHLEEYVKATEATAAAFAAQWNIGRRTMFDLLDTQAEAINAKSSLVTAKYDKMYAEYRVLSGMGKLVHSLGLQWPEESRVEGEPTDAAPVVVTVKKEEPAAATPPVVEPVKTDVPAPAAPPVIEPPAAAAPPVVEPVKTQEPAAAAPQAVEPVKQPEPASDKTSDGFIKADKDGFIKSR